MDPLVATTIEDLRSSLQDARRRGLTVGLVPTMGALHAGHASLIRAARQETGFVVVSIFVNPTQFGPREDFTRYPRPLEQDLSLCRDERADLVFAPEASAVYPPGYCTAVEVAGLQDVWEGTCRPGHFRGVVTVVLKLFNLVGADIAYFGQKDAQQARVIQQMVGDLNVPIALRICPTVREADGLAISSRNRYLDADQRRRAVVLYRALQEARTLIEQGERSAATVQTVLAKRMQATPGAELDYAAVIDADTLQPLDHLRGKLLLALAVKFGSTRLIDNLAVQVP